MQAELTPLIERILPEVVALRHELHQHPEIRFEEQWTSDRIARFLEEAGIPYERGYAKGTGIVATLTAEYGGTVALRADMDALEIQEETGLPYASTIPRRMHACGHDGHSAILCGTAKLLATHRKHLQGTVKFIFQPAEELAAGGKLMVEEGALDGVDAVFGLHGWPKLPCGQIGVREGFMLASACDFHITILGRGCHAADPASGVDPVLVAAHVTTALQSIISRETNPWESAVVSVSKIHAGDVTNIIPERAVLEGTFRTLSEERNNAVRASIERLAHDIARAFGATAEIAFSEIPYPPLFNDARVTAFARETISAALGGDRLVELPHPYMVSEDFAFYLQRCPGTFVCLGVHDGREGEYPALHSPHYDFNDAGLAPGIAYFASTALRFLTKGVA